ncbi:hypothetical protein LCGC14_2671920 [marine sediment metagenome]|uniref:Uncharacterized protein n=1 Tax=marine sediment metagenome TaxID=412755 RepID=A0A0F8ZNT5_9ZZZZ
MARRKKVKKKEVTPIERKAFLTTFIILFPAMIIAVLTTAKTSIFISGLAIALFCYQAILLKNFINDHYALG